MDFYLKIQDVLWLDVYKIPKGSLIAKGRKSELYQAITTASTKITQKCGCYSWGSESEIFYCGSFSEYNSDRFESSLHGRVHNYLQNHGSKDSERENTNRMVFNNLNRSLQRTDIFLRVLTFTNLQLGDLSFDFQQYSQDNYMVHTVEQLLINTYRHHGQCTWNRA